MRARKIFATTWARVYDRSWIYAGTGEGADIAAWKQAARAELAATGKWRAGYAQALLDLGVVQVQQLFLSPKLDSKELDQFILSIFVFLDDTPSIFIPRPFPLRAPIMDRVNDETVDSMHSSDSRSRYV